MRHLVFTTCLVFLCCLHCIPTAAAADDDDDDEGDYVTIEDAELEGPDFNVSQMSRKLQVNLTGPSHSVSLTLERNDYIPNEVTVVIGTGGKLSSQKSNLSQSSAYYYDASNEASFYVRSLADANGVHKNSYRGSFTDGNQLYVIQPADADDSRRRRRRSSRRRRGTDAYVVHRGDMSQPDNYEQGALELPAQAEMMRTMERDDGDGENTLPDRLDYVVETMLAIDYRLYSRFYDLSSGRTTAEKRRKTIESIQFYFGHVINGVHMRYQSINSSTFSISVRLAAYYIATDANSSWFIEQNRHGDGAQAYISAQPALLQFVDFINREKSAFPVFDQATLATSEFMNGASGNRIAGLAFFKSICTLYSSSLVRSFGELRTAQTIAHELGHNMATKHDQLDNACKAADNYIMVASPGQITDANRKNSFTFSPCSISEMEIFLRILARSKLNCLLSTFTERKEIPQAMAGQVFPPDVQCQITLGIGSYYCGGQTNDGNICRQMQCFHPQYDYCYSTYELRAFDGTTCGNKKWCRYGRCESDPAAVPAPDSCVFGDTKVPLESGLYCSNISLATAWRCYDSHIADLCCLTCQRFRNSTNKGCEYGDKAPMCQNIALSNCSDPQVKAKCCRACAGPLPPKDCPNGDLLANCASLVDSPSKCYTYANECCATCSRFKTNISDCPYGDRDATCPAISSRLECYFRSRTCCKTCHDRQTTNIAGCEWGDKAVKWCSGLSREQCYSNAETCCETCFHHNTGISGCEYGDKNQGWCTANVRYLYQCYSYESYCCSTCNYYRTGPTGCEYGDRDYSCPQRNCQDPANWKTCCRSCASYIPATTTTPTTATPSTATTTALQTTPTTTTSTTTTKPTTTTTSTTLPTTTTTTPTTTSRRTSTTKPTTTTTTTTTPTTTTTSTTTSTTTPTTTTLPTTTSTTTTTTVPPTTVPTTTTTTTRRPTTTSTTPTTTTRSTSTSTTTAPANVKDQDCPGDSAWWCPYIQASDCYDAYATCCKTCAKYFTRIPGCEYGDHYWWCSLGSYCYNDYLRQSCCITCGTAAAAPKCLDSDNSCSTIEAADCYKTVVLNSCCQTCSNFNTGRPGCEYGDRQSSCKNIDRRQCSTRRNDCCQTCR